MTISHLLTGLHGDHYISVNWYFHKGLWAWLLRRLFVDVYFIYRLIFSIVRRLAPAVAKYPEHFVPKRFPTIGTGFFV